jgi:hypothetical protein
MYGEFSICCNGTTHCIRFQIGMSLSAFSLNIFVVRNVLCTMSIGVAIHVNSTAEFKLEIIFL